VINRLRETLFIFLQGKPQDVDKNQIEEELLAVEHVKSIHHTHIWSLDGEHHVFSTHVKLKAIENFRMLLDVKREIKNILQKYPFEHYTIETELDPETCALVET
jgi:cobalt-zinc-cadmium efflux system protein